METLTMNQKEQVLEHLRGGKTLNRAEAKELYGINNLRNVVGYLKGEGVKIETVNGSSKDAYYVLSEYAKKHKKLLDVPEDIHKAVKRMAFECELRGEKVLEKDIFVEAIQIGIQQLAKKYL